MKKLSGKEELFCRLYASGGNAREAAFKAGYTVCSEIAAKKLLSKSSVREAVKAIERENCLSENTVRAGLHRVAFASSADAVKLVLAENYDGVDVESLDLFNVSEIKRAKGGGVEIKFFDRIKALEKLIELTDTGNSLSSQPFYAALENSAAAIGGVNE